MTITSGWINSQSKHDLICSKSESYNVSAFHGDEIPFQCIYYSFRIQRSNQKKIYIPQNKEHKICNIVCVFMFQQRLE